VKEGLAAQNFIFTHGEGGVDGLGLQAYNCCIWNSLYL